jgi:hypothetical protein
MNANWFLDAAGEIIETVEELAANFANERELVFGRGWRNY